MKPKSEDQYLIHQLRIRFEKKPRRCRKIYDSGIGSSDRIVMVTNDKFLYFPKIQEFNDLDFDKLQYVVPKAGIALSQILQLKFPPRRNNERNYFTIVMPKNKILKYMKSKNEMPIDQFAEGQLSWTFTFDYDIISLPRYEKKKKQTKMREQAKLLEKKRKQQEKLKIQKEEDNKKIQQQYNSLLQTEKLINLNKQNNDDNPKNQHVQKNQQKLDEADDFYFQYYYQKLLNPPSSQKSLIQLQLDFLQCIGKFKKKAENIVKNYIDQMPFNPKPKIGEFFKLDNLQIMVGLQKDINLQFLDNLEVAHSVYDCRQKINPQIRVPLVCFIKYKGFKSLVKIKIPINEKKDDCILHGLFEDTWKSHFFLTDDLNVLIEGLNLKPYFSDLQFQRVVIHLGSRSSLKQTQPYPYKDIKKLVDPKFHDFNVKSLIYITNIAQIYPIDLNLQQNVNQRNVRLRPQYVLKYCENVKLTGGALTYQIDDQQGNNNDLALAKASQNLKYKILPAFVQKLGQLQFVPLDSEHLKKIMKENGINIRYLGSLYKLTTLPYIRQMIKVEAIARQVKKIFREYQKDYSLQILREKNRQLIEQAYSSNKIDSIKGIRIKQLKKQQQLTSIEFAIDFLNLVFGGTKQTKIFWEMIKQKVKKIYSIEINNEQFINISHGYLLTTILFHCGIEIVLNNNLLLFVNQNPFTTKDWIGFKSRCVVPHYPSLKVYQKMKIDEKIDSDNIVTKLELQIYLKRLMGEDDSLLLVKLSRYIPDLAPPKNKYSPQSLLYYMQRPSRQNFEIAHEICSFIMPSTHPIFQDLYLTYASLKDFQPILFKKSAQNHAIKTLGLTHKKTAQILSNFKQDEHLKHLVQAEVGIANNKRMQLFYKIIKEQSDLGRYVNCFESCRKAIHYAQKKELEEEEQNFYFGLLMIGIQVTYDLRKLKDLIVICDVFWNSLEKYRYSRNCNHYIEHMIFYTLKVHLQYVRTKNYITKLVIVVNQKMQNIEVQPKNQLLLDLRKNCRDAKGHSNWIEEMLLKLTFGYSEINFYSDFFTEFDEHARNLKSEEFDEGLDELKLVLKIYKIKFFEEALLDRSYSMFESLSHWQINKKSNTLQEKGKKK